MPNSKWAAPTAIGCGPQVRPSNTKCTDELAALKPRAKKLRLLKALLDGPKTSFELEKAPVFDHCPNSTVSEWRKRGLEIHTEMVVVSGYGGEPAHIARYSLAPEARDRALGLVEVDQ
jgi:hypothetical protein